MSVDTLADRIRRAISPEQYEEDRRMYGDDDAWLAPARAAKRAKIREACERAIVAAETHPGASTMLELRGVMSAEDRMMVEMRLTSCNLGR